MSDKEILGIIPARGGSKGIPYKNITQLDKKPLLWYVYNAAKKSDSISRIVCSTDDKKISSVCEQIGIEVLMRPSHLAKDNSEMANVLEHALQNLIDEEGYEPRLIGRLQPTHPFLMPNHIDQVVGKVLSNDKVLSGQTLTKVPHHLHAYNQRVLSGQTLTKVPHHLHAYNQRVLEDGKVKFLFEKKREKNHNRQLKRDTYGSGNLCITESTAVKNGKNHFAKPSIGIEIEPKYSIDIDEQRDLKLAEWYLASEQITIP